MAKRRAGDELTRDNWDKDEEPEEIGCFQKASEEVLKGRIIKQARRHISNVSAESKPKSIFSGFTGFTGSNEQNKKFSFSSNLINSDKSSSNFLSKSDESDISKPSVKSNFPVFCNISNTNVSESNSDLNDDKNNSSSLSEFDNKIEDNSSCKKKIALPASTTLTMRKTNDVSISQSKDKLNELSKKLKKTADEKESKSDVNKKTPDDLFIQKLRSLNLLCAEWIIKHLNENLSYILTPIFDDYKMYLNQLKEERQRANFSNKRIKLNDNVNSIEVTKSNELSVSSVLFKAPDFKESLNKVNFSESIFNSKLSKTTEDKSGFKLFNFGDGDSTNLKFDADDKKENKSFCSTSNVSNNFFNFNSDSKSDGKQETVSMSDTKTQSFFSFGTDNVPLKNNSCDHNAAVTNNEVNPKDEDGDESPCMKEDVIITEEDSIYEKKCKVFIKKDNNFVDHGIGFLFLKLIGDEKKCQLIVRANNKLATIMLNVLLTSNVPIQLMGKNNIMIICCPTPDSKPSSVLLKVKTEEDAKDLLNVLNKYKN